MQKYGYYASHGGFANYRNGLSGMKYRKTRQSEYVAQQGLAHNNGILSSKTAPQAQHAPDAIRVGELYNEIVIDNHTKSNEELRLNALNAPELEFVDDMKSGVSMAIIPEKKPASGKALPLRKDSAVRMVKFDG